MLNSVVVYRDVVYQDIVPTGTALETAERLATEMLSTKMLSLPGQRLKRRIAWLPRCCFYRDSVPLG